jgi:cytoskeletal protein CcmA (bactofilin family)
MMFRRKDETPAEGADRVDSVIGAGLALKGTLTGTGGIRIEGAFEGDVELLGLVVVGEQGRVTCRHLKAGTVVVAGSVRGDITAQRVEIMRTGRVWGNVVTAAFSTEEGAFLRGQITMEEKVDVEPGPQAGEGNA